MKSSRLETNSAEKDTFGASLRGTQLDGYFNRKNNRRMTHDTLGILGQIMTANALDLMLATFASQLNIPTFTQKSSAGLDGFIYLEPSQDCSTPKPYTTPTELTAHAVFLPGTGAIDFVSDYRMGKPK